MNRYAIHTGSLILSILLAAVSVNAQDRTVLKTQGDKENYKTGVEFVRSLQKQGGSVNLDLVIKGMKDALTGETISISDDEIRKDLASREPENAEQQQANKPAAQSSEPSDPQKQINERADDPVPSNTAFAKKDEPARKTAGMGGVAANQSGSYVPVAQRGQYRNELKLRGLELRRHSIEQGL